MADIFTPEKRSRIMANIKSKNTLLEAKGFALLRRAGLAYRKYPKAVIGKPDAANKKRKIAIFFDGDFWHGFEFEKWRDRLPKTYWREKIESNIARDKRVTEELESKGWKVIRFWEHQIKKTPEECVDTIESMLKD